MVEDRLIAEQIEYYRAIADEYEDYSIDAPGQADLLAAFDSFDIVGDVLELACGPGLWTEKLISTAESLTAVDASEEMTARAQARVQGQPVTFIQSDLFEWLPTRRYDSVFFGFWLSHVPNERFEAFWQMIISCLQPGGTVFFVDDNHRTAQELIEGPDSPIVERRSNDGTRYWALKVPHDPVELEQRLHSLGWRIKVRGSGPFYWGSGGRAR